MCWDNEQFREAAPDSQWSYVHVLLQMNSIHRPVGVHVHVCVLGFSVWVSSQMCNRWCDLGQVQRPLLANEPSPPYSNLFHLSSSVTLLLFLSWISPLFFFFITLLFIITQLLSLLLLPVLPHRSPFALFSQLSSSCLSTLLNALHHSPLLFPSAPPWSSFGTCRTCSSPLVRGNFLALRP